MTLRVCVECMATVPAGRTRCTDCARRRDAARGRRQARGYDANHDRLRREYQSRMDADEQFTCWRCHKPIDPATWHLGHDDHDRTTYRGPECVGCNTATSGRT